MPSFSGASAIWSAASTRFVVTIVLMGFATFAIGLLPGFASIGIAAPVVFVALRMLQGLAMGGEYGGAVIYVAEHAPDGRRGSWTSWIQTTGSLALLMSLGVILLLRYALGEAAFADWGWRIPFLLSIVLLLISVWIRLKLNESPAFIRMKAQGRTSKAPLSGSVRPVAQLEIDPDRVLRSGDGSGRDLVHGPVLLAYSF